LSKEEQKQFEVIAFRCCSILTLQTVFVELAGVEPASGQETHMLSTCLVPCLHLGSKMVRNKPSLLPSLLKFHLSAEATLKLYQLYGFTSWSGCGWSAPPERRLVPRLSGRRD